MPSNWGTRLSSHRTIELLLLRLSWAWTLPIRALASPARQIEPKHVWISSPWAYPAKGKKNVTLSCSASIYASLRCILHRHGKVPFWYSEKKKLAGRRTRFRIICFEGSNNNLALIITSQLALKATISWNCLATNVSLLAPDRIGGPQKPIVTSVDLWSFHYSSNQTRVIFFIQTLYLHKSQCLYIKSMNLTARVCVFLKKITVHKRN